MEAKKLLEIFLLGGQAEFGGKPCVITGLDFTSDVVNFHSEPGKSQNLGQRVEVEMRRLSPDQDFRLTGDIDHHGTITFRHRIGRASLRMQLRPRSAITAAAEDPQGD